MRIEWTHTTGKVAESLPRVKARLNGYLASYDKVYIGATTDPRNRSDAHEENGWAKMVLLYKTRSPVSCATMEKAAIKHARSSSFKVKPENVLSGGNSIPGDRDEYFVYVLVD